jgi:hypothetical protein
MMPSIASMAHGANRCAWHRAGVQSMLAQTIESLAGAVEGVLAARVDSDFPDPPDEFSGRIAIYTNGRFLWSAGRKANPGFVFDPVSINTLKTKGITFEAAYVNNRWVGAP